MGAWKTYRSLTAEQKQILAKKQLEMNRSADELLALLKPIAACDAVANKAQTRFGCTFGLFIVLSIFMFILFVNVGGAWQAGVVLLLLLAAAVACGWFWMWLRGIDVSDNLRGFVVPVLALFREDFDPQSPVHLRLDLTKPTAPAKKTSEGDPYKQGAYHKIIDSTYVDPWMSAEAVLVDGTKLAWSVTDRIRERKKTKRNPRGKIKTKTKYTKKTDLEVAIAMRTKTYAIENAEVSSDGKRGKVEVQKSLRTDSLNPIDPRTLIDAITEVYRAARPAQKGAGA